ncbi:hypothetical protein [Streptomyces sp. NPDC002215]|uniref:hypothetical protein n=1 Tax=Streptomyces sp. NPDC002215 TaxID=3154412 RepID=UPI003333188A
MTRTTSAASLPVTVISALASITETIWSRNPGPAGLSAESVSMGASIPFFVG